MEAYNYFQSVHVRDVKVYTVVASCSRVLLAYSNPGMLTVKFDETVLTVHCTCKLGKYWQTKRYYTHENCLHVYNRLGEGCSHAAAILFKIECAVRNGYTAGTSSQCSWNQVFSTKVSFVLMLSSSYFVDIVFCCCSMSQPRS